MLVVCGRCETEYEFDDTLLSERGTTVKCTNCGYQFRVRPPRGVSAGADRWIVMRADGSRANYPSLRELRRAIEGGAVSLEDEIARGAGPRRKVREVPELEALFRRRSNPGPPQGQTLVGVGVPDRVKNAPLPARDVVASASNVEPRIVPNRQKVPLPGGTQPVITQAKTATAEAPKHDTPPPTSLMDMGRARRSSPPRRPAQTPQGTPVAYESFSSDDRKSASFATVPPPAAPGAPPPAADLAATWTSPERSGTADTHSTQEVPVHPVTADPPPAAPTAPDPADVAAPTERAPVPASAVQFASVPPPSVMPPPQAGSDRSNAAPAPLSVPPPPRKGTSVRWVVALVLLGGIALLAGTVGRQYLAQFVGGDGGSSAAADSLVEAGWEAFRDGDLLAASRQFQQAKEQAPEDPSVLLGLIQLDVVQADFEWLRLRLMPDADEAKRSAAQKALDEHVSQAKAAFAKVPRVPATAKRTALIETDALRVEGKYDQARSLVQRSNFDATDPHAAYVLALLDLGEGSPAWSTVTERLRNALVSERGLGRARSALVYALAASGDIEKARAELSQLKSREQPHPLAADLEIFVDTLAAGQPEADAEGEGTPVADDGKPEPEEPAAADSASGRGVNAAWLFLDRASKARRSGDLAGAKLNYEKALKESPGNAAALAGLGSIARLGGKYQEAKRYFDQVLERSPNHLPSLVGGADVRWLMGAKDGAVLLYRKIPSGTAFYSHAQRRIAEFEGRGGSPDEGAPGGSAVEENPAGEDSEGAAPDVSPAPEAAPKGDTPSDELGSESAAPKLPDTEAPKAQAAPDEPSAGNPGGAEP